MNKCVDSEVDLKCPQRLIKDNDGNIRCTKHHNYFRYGQCSQRHFERVPASGKDGLCYAHRKGVYSKKTLAVGDINQYGVLIVSGHFLKQQGDTKNRYFWKALCPVCSQEYDIATGDFEKRKSCAGCKGTFKRKSSQEISWKNAHAMLKARGKTRSKDVEITLEQFIEISTKNCYYCGAEPTETKGPREWSETFFSNGLDRIDSSMGYLYNNVVACCKWCNVAKLDRSVEEFYSWVAKLAKHQSLM
jgi:hypothetical protein